MPSMEVVKPQNLQVRLSQSPEGSSITVIYRGESYDATDDHPNFKEIVAGALADDPSVIDLFDIAKAVGTRIGLSERFRYASGRLFFDGDELDGALADGIMGLVNDGEDPKILVAFAENLMDNPEPHSRKQLYSFLNGQKFTMTPDGKLIMYKGVEDSGKKDDGKERYLSRSQGTAWVNGEVHEGQIPQHIGDVVEMPRSEVQHDPHNACSVGLHAATFGFAKGFIGGSGPVLELEVNPRDVVSVPSHDREKVRVSRYKVLGVVTAGHERSVRREEPKPEPAGRRREEVRTHKAQPISGGKPELQPGKRVRHPSAAVFEEFKAKAKKQKMGLVRYCLKHGLRQIKGDGKSREDWEVAGK